MKTCKTCQIVKPYEMFDTSRTNKDGASSWCKQCTHEYYLKRYEAKRKLKPIIKTETHRQCRICMQAKPYAEFKSRSSTYCTQCISDYGHIRNIKRYGITANQYHEMSVAQQHLCKICNQKDKKRLSVDHDHKCCKHAGSCGKCIRGLICSRCNVALGMLNDDIAVLKAMIDYLT